MNVKLISHSQQSGDSGDLNTAQDLVAFCARVSNPSIQSNTKT